MALGAGFAGCVGRGRDPGASAPGRLRTVSLMAAGSLNSAFEHGLKPALSGDLRLEIEAHGSATAARLLAEGQRDPDLVALADTALFDGPLHPDWYAEFATNALVIAYRPEASHASKLAAAPDRWYAPLLAGAVRLGRTDPDEDPLGYRTLFLFELAGRYYGDAPDLRTRLLQRDQIYPETALVSQFETGSIDVAVTYRSMAIERGYAYIDLPPQIDLSDPAYASDWYATASHTLPGGKTVTGSVIRYGATIRHLTPRALRVFRTLCTGAYLRDFGFIVPRDYPTYHGQVPPDVIA